MEENEIKATYPIDGYTLKASFNFKGKFALIANFVVIFLTLLAIVSTIFIFDYDLSDIPEFLINLAISLLVFSLLLVGFLIIGPIISIIIYKAGGGGKLKLHIGLIIAIGCENPLPRNVFLLAQLLSSIIPIALIAVLAIFVWMDAAYFALMLVLSNMIGMLPLYIFLFKQAKTDFINFEKGKLDVLIKNGEL